MSQTRAVWSLLAVTMRWPSGAKGCGPDETRMNLEHGELVPGRGIPNAGRLVIARSHDALALGAKRCGQDVVRMTLEPHELAPGARSQRPKLGPSGQCLQSPYVGHRD